ncbi:MAG: AAA family ATPase [Planctomycetota bacterium]|nr:AAA family ATPase [Planctomycetota bacterium]
MRPIEAVKSKLEKVKPNGKGWTACCPAHDDRTPSLSINEGDDGRVLVHCHAGCTSEAICSALGIEQADLFKHEFNSHATKPRSAPKPSPIFNTADEAIEDYERSYGPQSNSWAYFNAEGEPVGFVLRWDKADGKEIRPVSWTGEGWIKGGMPKPRPLYGLLMLNEASTIYVCEGEKAADAAAALGLTATTSSQGSGSAHLSDWTVLSGKDIVILPDADRSGRKYADQVIEILSELDPEMMIKIVDLPDLPEGGDIFEFNAERRLEGKDDLAIRTEIEDLAGITQPVVFDKVIKDEQKTKASVQPIIVNLADVEPEEVQWLWPGRIALGKVTLIAGDPGLGKSFLTLDMAARISSGTSWPDDRDALNQVGGIVLLSAEDDLGDTIRPRLDAAGADVARICAISSVKRLGTKSEEAVEDSFCLATDLTALEASILQTPDCRLVIIDPISAYLGRVDSHKMAELRGILTPLGALASRHRVAVVCIHHLNKNSGGQAIYRACGSIGFVAAARAAWIVTKDKDDERRRLFLPVKNNLASDMTGLAYTIELIDQGGAPAVAWEPDPVEISADEAMSASQGDGEDRLDAKSFLLDLLADGEIPGKDVLDEAKEAGFSDKVARRALKSLGGKPRRSGFGKGGQWIWSLPNVHTCPIDAIVAPSLDEGNKGNNGSEP